MTKYTISKESQHHEKIVDSRFLGHIFPAKNRENVDRILAKIKREHPKATHICWACRYLNESNGQIEYYFSDAGEPTGTAGKPILKAIENKNIINVMCVVVRYFGGTKLGRGGLMRAYGGVATRTIEKAKIIPYEKTVSLKFQSSYKLYPTLEKFLRNTSIAFEATYNNDNVIFNIPSLPESRLDEVKNKVIQLGCTLIK